jgi:crooked neck
VALITTSLVLPPTQIWVLAAKLEVRQKRLDSARKILGMALGMAPKDKTYKAYIELELQLGNIDR